MGYIGITGYQLNKNFNPYDILIGFKHISSSHTSEVISYYLEKYIEDYNLENKLTCIVTDNGSNIKVAAKILNENNNNIQRQHIYYN